LSTAASKTGPSKDAQLSYEEARAELVATVERLEAGGATLEESLKLWERGEALADQCQAHLEGARERLKTRTEPESESE